MYRNRHNSVLIKQYQDLSRVDLCDWQDKSHVTLS